ncbi:hypothetical protein C1646_754632 [Rhizophagus diaphanus]|nr:hypothetical protein C1646_754632 [Rhizophagus diaphanus] [Rhizophagus sp. MUCL 43196]
MTVCESGTASPSKLEEIIIELRSENAVHNAVIFDLKTRTRSSVRNLRVEESIFRKLEVDIQDRRNGHIFTSISLKKLANLFYQANNAKKSTIKAKRTEISSWCCFSERFEDKVMELRSEDKKLTNQTTRKRIYNEMKPFLQVFLIGWHMIHRDTCSADSISRLINHQIKYIIDQVNSKTVNNVNDQSHVSKEDAPAEERTDEVVCVEEDSAHSFNNPIFMEDPFSWKDLFSLPTQHYHARLEGISRYIAIILLSSTLINRNRKEVARLEAIKVINDVEDIKIFDDDFFSDEPIDSNHPINARTERGPEEPRISVQVNEQSCREVELGFRVGA